MGGIEHAARGISGGLGERLPWQRKTQRENLALLVATMLSERSANLMALAAALPREPGRIDMRYQWIVRVLANPLIACDAVMLPFAREVLAQAQAEARPGERVELILDQSRASERHQILMLALRWGERALPLAWRVEETPGPIGFAGQQQLLDTVAAWLPEAARVRLLGDRFSGTPALIAHCQALDWDDRLRLNSPLTKCLFSQDDGPSACSRRSELGWRYGREERSEWPGQRRHRGSGAGSEYTSRAPRPLSGFRPRSTGASAGQDCARRHGSDSAYG